MRNNLKVCEFYGFGEQTTMIITKNYNIRKAREMLERELREKLDTLKPTKENLKYIRNLIEGYRKNEEHSLELMTRYILAEKYYEIDEFDIVEMLLKNTILNINEKYYSPVFVYCLILLAITENCCGNHGNMIYYFEEGLKISTKIKEENLKKRLLLNLAMAHIYEDSFEEALYYLDRLAKMKHLSADMVVRQYLAYIICYTRLNKIEEATRHITTFLEKTQEYDSELEKMRNSEKSDRVLDEKTYLFNEMDGIQNSITGLITFASYHFACNNKEEYKKAIDSAMIIIKNKKKNNYCLDEIREILKLFLITKDKNFLEVYNITAEHLKKNKYYGWQKNILECYIKYIDDGKHSRELIEAFKTLKELEKKLSDNRNKICKAYISNNIKFNNSLIKKMIDKQKLVIDEMTGLPNKNALNDEAGSLHICGSLGVIRADIDRFRLINDSYGNNIGDAIVKNFANILKKFSTPSIKVFRIGGDDFLILIRDQANIILKELKEDIKDEIMHSKIVGVSYAVSMGSVYLNSKQLKEMNEEERRQNGENSTFFNMEKLLELAEKKLYAEKKKKQKKDS